MFAWLTNWFYCPKSDERTECLLCNTLTHWNTVLLTILSEGLQADWMIYDLLIDCRASFLNLLTEILHAWLYCKPTNWLWFMADWLTLFSEDWLTYWIVYRWLIDLMTLILEVLTNWMDDLWLIVWLSNWLYYPKTDKLTECSLGNTFIDPLKYCMTDSSVWGSTSWLNDLWLIDWLTDWLT